LLSQSVEEKKAMRAEVVALVEELQIPKSPDDLLSTYEGREKELLKNLNKMKAKKAEEVATIAAIKVLVDELAVPRSADEMLETYKGREGVLLTNLKKMSTKKLRDSEIKAEIEDLVAELDAPKSADEMLASYQGREEVLLANLRKLKSKKDLSASQLAKKEATIAEIRIICDLLTLPKTADDMISGYEGREEELLKNLQKMKAKNDMAAELKASKADTIAEVTSLCGELKLPKNADEMLASYEGREEELLKNLQKMKSKQESAAALKASKAATIAEVTSLCDELKPGKSAEELLAAYEGREQELVTHLKKLQTSKRNA
jgi:phosphopantetheine adenylyltransferase